MAFGAFVPSIRAWANPRSSASGNGRCVLPCFRFLQALVSLAPCLLESRFQIFKPVLPERFSVFVNGRNRSLWPELLADEADICCHLQKDFIKQRCGVYSGEGTSGPFFCPLRAVTSIFRFLLGRSCSLEIVGLGVGRATCAVEVSECRFRFSARRVCAGLGTNATFSYFREYL